jgi:Flp pilus assembly protein CpaB
MSSVVVALQAIPQGTQFAAGQPLDQFFGVKQVPTSMIPFGAYTTVRQISNLIRSVGSTGCSSATSAACRGQVTVTQTIYQNLPVLSGMFSTLGQFRLSAGPAFQIPYGYVAIGVNFAATNSVLGSIQPGDDIDLMASLTGLEGSDGNKIKVPTQTQYVLNDIRVIGVNGPPPTPSSSSSSLPSATSSSSANNGAGGQLLLMVRYQQALIVQHLKDFGGSWSISAVLRSSKETDIPHFKTMPVTERWFFIKQENHFDWSNPY